MWKLSSYLTSKHAGANITSAHTHTNTQNAHVPSATIIVKHVKRFQAVSSILYRKTTCRWAEQKVDKTADTLEISPGKSMVWLVYQMSVSVWSAQTATRLLHLHPNMTFVIQDPRLLIVEQERIFQTGTSVWCMIKNQTPHSPVLPIKHG